MELHKMRRFCLVGMLITIACVCSCTERKGAAAERAAADTRIRQYFDISSSTNLTMEAVVSALMHRYPTGTSLQKIRADLEAKGVGKDNLSAVQWQESIKRLDCSILYAPRATATTHLNIYFEFNELGELKGVYGAWQDRGAL
jgi:hypothetical protein